MPPFLRTYLPLLPGALLMLAAASANANAAVKTEVADLRYGVALYHYYQQDYIPAISELLVADARDGIQGHGNNPELIAGGLSLAFGMQNHAEQLFSRLLQDQSRPQPVRDAAWFYLGKLQYTRGDWPAAMQSFSRVSEHFSSDTGAELRALQINLHIKNNDIADLSLKKIQQGQLAQWQAYALYNLGAAQARNNNLTSAKEFFNELAGLSAVAAQAPGEYLALRDKAHTALGYSYLQEQSYLAAINEFRQVRLEGIAANQALLGYGWAAMAQEKYAEAIRPWQLLQQRSLLYPEAQESLLALPFAYEKLQASGEALREYERAEQLLDGEIALVRELRSNLGANELLTLVGSQPVARDEFNAREKTAQPGTITALITDDGQNWLKLSDSSVIKTRSVYLRELFAQTEFQVAVLELRDLLKLQSLLQSWQPKLIAYSELLQQKQAWRQQQEQQLAQQSLAQQQTALEQQRATLVTRIDTIKNNTDYLALADAQTRKSFALVERSQQRLAQLKTAGQDTSDYEEKLWMARGILLWRAAQDYPTKLNELEQSLAQIDSALAHINLTRAQLTAIVGSGQDLQPLQLRIQQQQGQIGARLQEVNSVIAQRAEALRLRVDAQLNAHEKRLNRYLAQAHLAVARLYDTALRKQVP